MFVIFINIRTSNVMLVCSFIAINEVSGIRWTANRQTTGFKSFSQHSMMEHDSDDGLSTSEDSSVVIQVNVIITNGDFMHACVMFLHKSACMYNISPNPRHTGMAGSNVLS